MQRKLALLGAFFALLTLSGGVIAPAALSNDDNGNDNEGSAIVRWDLVQFVSGVILSGGPNVSVDEPTGDTLTLTGTGHAEPGHEKAFGGGTFVHAIENGNGNGSVHGAYYVTDFISWRLITEGSLEGTGLIDGIGDIDEATSGVLKVRITLVPEVNGEPGPTARAKLIIYCRLPGATVGFVEGVRVRSRALGLDFVQHEDPETAGFTLFHVLG